MKRILSTRGWMCLICLSVFFTGCNRGSSTSYQIETSDVTVPPYTTEEETRETVGEKNVKESIAQEADKLMDGRLQDLGGVPAFWFPENYSKSPEDMRQFKVLGLKDQWIYYAYITRDTGTNQFVRMITRYNYQTKEHKILYQQQMDHTEEAGQLMTQMYKTAKGEWRIAVYDRGDLIVVDDKGETLFNRSGSNGDESMSDMIDRIFHVGESGKDAYYGCDVVNVITDGQYRFYFQLSLTKDDYTTIDKDSEEDIDTDSFLLQYDYTPVGLRENGDGEYLIVYNENAQRQIEEWRKKADNATGKRDPKTDWEAVLKEHPDSWVVYRVIASENGREKDVGFLGKWKSGKQKFAWDEHGTPFVSPEAGLIIYPVGSLDSGQKMDEYFFIGDSKYYSLHGEVKSVNTETRQVTRYYSYEVTNGDKSETIDVTETVDYNWRKRTDFAKEAVAEGFYVIKLMNMGAELNLAGGTAGKDGESLVGMYSGTICLLTEAQGSNFTSKGTVSFPKPGPKESTYDMEILNRVKNEDYVMASDIRNGRIYVERAVDLTKHSLYPPVTLVTSDLNYSGYQENEEDEPLRDELKKIGQKSKDKSNLSGMNLYANPDRYGKDNIIVLDEKSLLITTLYNGMQLYEGDVYGSNGDKSTPGTVSVLSKWPLYQSWLSDTHQVTAIGFDKEDASYSYGDIIYARVFTWNLDQVKRNAPSYKVPLNLNDIKKEEKPTLGVPEQYEKFWNEAEEKRKAPTSADSTESTANPETVPEVTIYETEEYMKEKYESRAEELKKEREETGGGETDENQ